MNIKNIAVEPLFHDHNGRLDEHFEFLLLHDGEEVPVILADRSEDLAERATSTAAVDQHITDPPLHITSGETSACFDTSVVPDDATSTRTTEIRDQAVVDDSTFLAVNLGTQCTGGAHTTAPPAQTAFDSLLWLLAVVGTTERFAVPDFPQGTAIRTPVKTKHLHDYKKER